MKRIFGQIGKLKAGKIEEYKQLHRETWPEVLKVIGQCNLRNYSIFIQRDTVFSYFEYIGEAYETDMERMESDGVTIEWWKHTKPCFERFVFTQESEFYHDMEQIFYYEGE